MTRKLRMSELFRLMEEASIAHTEELGCTREKTLDRGLLWIITRQQAEIEEMPAYDEEIIVRSWQGDMMHVFFPRFYEIEREGRVIVRGQALWMLLDEETREMIMPEDYDIYIPGRPGSEDMMLAPIVIPGSLREEKAEICGLSESSAGAENGDSDKVSDGAEIGDSDEKKTGLIYDKGLVTRFSQVDINGHMNNTRYFDILDDAVYEMQAARYADDCGCEAVNEPGSKPDGENATDCRRESDSESDGEPDGEKGGAISGRPETFAWRTPRLVRANYISELIGGERFDLKAYRDENGALLFEGADEDKVKFRIALEY